MMCTKSSIFALIITFYTITNGKPARVLDSDYGYIMGYVTHGINNFNGESIVDLMGDGYGYLFQGAPYEQQVLNPGGTRAILPDATTDRDTPLSTGIDFTEWVQGLGLDVTPPEDIFNIPYLEIGVTTAASTSIDGRQQLKSFDEAGMNPSDVYPLTYYPSGTLTTPTLADWETASGLIEVECDPYDHSAMVEVTVCGMLPSSVYTVWEVGVTNPGPDETMYYHPAGGVANIIRTDMNGAGKLEFKMPWCPVRECVPGTSKDCQIYFSVFHHSDYIVWGGDAVGIAWKPYSYPAGVAGSNHLYFPLKGRLLQDPLNRFCRNRCRGRDQSNYGYKYKKSYK